MQRMALILLVWLAGITAALAQNVTVVGPITPGNCPQFSSTTVLKDSGALCNGSSPTSPSASVGLTVVPGTATSSMRSDAAPPLSASVQSALTGTNGGLLVGTGAFGFGTSPAVNGDGTLNTATGALTVNKLQGVPVNPTSAATNDVLAYNGTSFVHSAFVTLVNTVCTASPSSCTSLFGYVYPQWYGAKCDGSTDDTIAFNNMLAASGGKTILIPAATCVVSAHLNLVSNTRIMGSGRDVSVIKMTGADFIFNIASISNVSISNLWLLGTDSYTSWSVTRYGAINITAGTAQSNLSFTNLRLSAFNANYWIGGTQTAVISNVVFDNIWMNSALADVPTDVTQTNNTNYGLVLYSGSAGVRWENVTMSNIQIDGTYMCFGLVQYSDFYKWKIINNRLLNLGVSLSGNHCTNGLGALNAYGILVYDANADGNPPNDGLISGNYILNPAASGIYHVGDGSSFLLSHNSAHTLISNNTVVGQTQADTQLPRGGIVVSLTTDVDVTGNFLFNDATGINIAAQNAGTVSVIGNHIESSAGSSIGLQLSGGANGSSNADTRVVRSNYFKASGTDVLQVSATGSRFNNIDFSGNTVDANATGINFANGFYNGLLTIANNSFMGSAAGNMFLTAGFTGAVAVQGNVFYAPASNAPTVATLPAYTASSSIYVSDGAPGSSPCTGTSTGSTAFRQNGAWKCF